MAEKRYIEYFHTSRSEDNLYKFFNKKNPLIKDISLYEFLMFGKDGDKNIDRIYKKYDNLNQNRFSDLYRFILNSTPDIVRTKIDEIENMPFNLNTTVNIPTDNYKNELVAIGNRNLFLEQKNIIGFWSKKFIQIISDPNYIPSENISYTGEGSDVYIKNQNLQVWIWGIFGLGRRNSQKNPTVTIQ